MKEIFTATRKIEVCTNHLLVEDIVGAYGPLGVIMDNTNVKDLIKALVTENNIPLEEIVEHINPTKYYYKLPEILQYNPIKSYLNRKYNCGVGKDTQYMLDSKDESDSRYTTKFTEEEFKVIVKLHPEFSIMERQDIIEEDK